MAHPKALTPLFLTEMWERYGYYIVQGLLVLFLTKQFQYDDHRAFVLVGTFTAMINILPLLGGVVADRLLGYRYAILIGGCLLCLGYALTATLHPTIVTLGLAITIVGNGFLKPNISSYLGEFYTANDPRRDAGFTIFYIGINLGAILSTVSSGYIQQYFGWHAVFISAAFGMLIAIVSFLLGQDRYADYGLPLQRYQITPQFLKRFQNKTSLIALLFLIIAMCHWLLEKAVIANVLLGMVGICTLLGLIWLACQQPPEARNKIIAIVIMVCVSVLFWGLFMQLFFSLSLFIERSVDRTVFGYQIPTVAFIALESIFIVITGPFFAWLWRYLGSHNWDISTPVKFALALMAVAAATQLLVFAIAQPNLNGLINPLWIVAAYLAVTVGEMLLSPIGLSMVTQLAPPHLKGLLMGVWFMGLGFGGWLAGVLAEQAVVPPGVTSLAVIEQVYSVAFRHYTLLAIAASILVLCLAPSVNRLMGQR